jgi:hypothetical protein
MFLRVIFESVPFSKRTKIPSQKLNVSSVEIGEKCKGGEDSKLEHFILRHA